MKNEIRDVMKNVEEIISKLNSLDDILTMAVSIENEGKEFYEKHAIETSNESARDLYNYLAKEEAKHAAYMKAYMTEGDTPIIKTDDITFTPSFSKEFTDNLDELGVLLAALRLERKNEYFYTTLASQAKDKGQQEMFEVLASFEREHYDLIDYMIEDATRFRVES